ncbi:thioredoxin-disulfide reductase [Chloroflexota bacterium]
MNESEDMVIIGGGPAGLTAGLYAARSGLRTMLVEKALPGGQLTMIELVENYPGFPEGIAGPELGRMMEEQAAKYGLRSVNAEVQGIEIEEKDRIVKTSGGNYRAGTVVIAGGSQHHRLGVPGEAEFLGRGVSYCATCDGPLFRDEVAAVVGGGNVAITEALHLSRWASKVVVIHRRRQLRATRLLQDRAFANPKIEFLWDTVVEEITGSDMMAALMLRDVKTGQGSRLDASGVFVAVGLIPNTGYLEGLLALAPGGFIPVNGQMETEASGIFAAGDIRFNSPRQVVTAVGDGATAALSAERSLG